MRLKISEWENVLGFFAAVESLLTKHMNKFYKRLTKR